MVGLIVWLVLAALTIVVCAAVIFAVRGPMRELLGANAYISPARSFYLRVFTVLVVLAALATISDAGSPDADNDKAFMEYVWWIAGALQRALFLLSMWLIVYAAILAVLFVVLGRYHD